MANGCGKWLKEMENVTRGDTVVGNCKGLGHSASNLRIRPGPEKPHESAEIISWWVVAHTANTDCRREEHAVTRSPTCNILQIF